MAPATEGQTTQAFRTRSGVTGAVKTGVATAVKVRAAATYQLAVAIDAGSAAFGALVSEFTKKPTQENQTMREIQALHALKQSNSLDAHFRGWEERRRGLRRAKAETETMEALRKQQLTGAGGEGVTPIQELREHDRRAIARDLGERNPSVRLAEDSPHLAEGGITVPGDLHPIQQPTRRNIEEQEEANHDQTGRDAIVTLSGRFSDDIEQDGGRGGEEATTALPPNWVLSEDEINDAKIRVQYDPGNFHFAIAGQAGSGKSSLINAFLNLSVGDPGAATVGVTETTKHICRFEDRGTALPRPWTVWYDIPGAGTLRVPHEQYFKHQALYIFDVIILTVGDRFEKSDCQIIEDCEQFRIPYIIVRSKSDMHIDNMVKDKLEAFDGKSDKEMSGLREECRDEYRELSRKTVINELRKAGLAPREVLCVSKAALRKTYSSTLTNGTINPDDLLDEIELVNQLMFAAKNRRHPHENPADLIEVSRHHTPGRIMNLVTVIGDPIDVGLQQTQEPQTLLEWRRVLRLPVLPQKPTVNDISRELDTNDTPITSMLAMDPEIRSRTVVVLTFHPGTEIPDHIKIFGETLRVIMYEDKPRTTRNPAGEGRRRGDSQNGERRDYGRGGHGEPSRRTRQAERGGRGWTSRGGGQSERRGYGGRGGRGGRGGLGEGTRSGTPGHGRQD